MTRDKLETDSKTLYKFIQLNCDKRHHDVPKKKSTLHVIFKDEVLSELPYNLCEECETLFIYAYGKLKNCPHEHKPSCRKCPNPCYEKPMWKKMANVMMFSGMQLGLTKLRKLFTK